MKPSTGAAVRLHRNAVRDRPESLSAFTGIRNRHALMTMMAYAFVQSRRLKAAGRKKKNLRTATTTKYAGHQASDPRPLRTTSTPTMSSL